MINAKTFFSDEQKQSIKEAIAQAEKNTSGEIRVHIENSFKGQVVARAALIFRMLKMHKTELRNGVLIYLAIENRQFAIIGDAGINQVVPENFWDQIKDVMTGHFREGKFVEGLRTGIQMAGEQLKRHFPYQDDDRNELSDEISFDE